jgi:hypothetical protein
MLPSAFGYVRRGIFLWNVFSKNLYLVICIVLAKMQRYTNLF